MIYLWQISSILLLLISLARLLLIHGRISLDGLNNRIRHKITGCCWLALIGPMLAASRAGRPVGVRVLTIFSSSSVLASSNVAKWGGLFGCHINSSLDKDLNLLQLNQPIFSVRRVASNVFWVGIIVQHQVYNAVFGDSYGVEYGSIPENVTVYLNKNSCFQGKKTLHWRIPSHKQQKTNSKIVLDF